MRGNPKKILIIDNLAVESARRGLYRLLSRRPGFDVHLLVPKHWKETTTEIVCENEPQGQFALHTSGIFFGHRAHRVVYSDLFRIIRKVRPDFVLAVHAPENYATLQLLAARRFVFPWMKIGLVASRNIDLPSIGFPYKLAFLNSLCDWVTENAKVDVVYHRPKEFGNLYERYTDKAVYLPHHVDCSVFKRDESERRGSSAITIGYVGRLTEAKGVHILIEAISQMQQRVMLHVVGEGPYLVRLKELTDGFGIADRVKFESPVRYSEIPGVLNRFDLLVLPSLETAKWKELFGRILIEAMACEVPVVASSSGGIPDVISDAGVLFRTGNVADLVDRLSELVTDPAKAKALGKRGRARVMKLFDSTVVADLLEMDLLGVLDGDKVVCNR